jgi:hypothetical protein
MKFIKALRLAVPDSGAPSVFGNDVDHMQLPNDSVTQRTRYVFLEQFDFGVEGMCSCISNESKIDNEHSLAREDANIWR